METEPPKEILCQLSEKKLAQISEFRIWNKHGEVFFLEPVDLRYG